MTGLSFFGALLTLGQAQMSPIAPEGWTLQTAATGWVLAPKDLKEGEIFNAAITRPEKKVGALEAFYDALWGALSSFDRLDKVGEAQTAKLFGWDCRSGVAFATKGGRIVSVAVMAFEKGDQHFSYMSMASATALHEKHTPVAMGAIAKMLGGGGAETKPPAPPTEIGATFPAGWQREDQGLLKVGHYIHPQDRRRDRYLILFPPEPITVSLEDTFARIWNRETDAVNIKLQNKGLLSPLNPAPLRKRLASGGIVLWEGGEAIFGNLNAYMQLFVVPTETAVIPVLAVYGIGFGSSLEAERAPSWAFVESLKVGAKLSPASLFETKDCIGLWKLDITVTLAGFYSASGAYLGDASTGGMEELDLRSNGEYYRFLVAKSPTSKWSHREFGKWTVKDDMLTLTPTKGLAQKHRIYGIVSINRQKQLLLGAADGSRLPTDALENGKSVEIITNGVALLRYVKG